MDLSKLSTEDLQALAAGDMSKVSEDGLRMLAGQSGNTNLADMAGLGVRAAVKGVSAVPAMFSDAIGGVANAAQDAVLGKGKGFRFQQALPALDRAMTQMGIPEPDTPMQRITSKGVENAIGALSGAKMAGTAADLTTNTTREVFKRLAADPNTQALAAATGGVAGQQAAETGGGFISQLVSSVIGSLTGGLTAAPVKSAASMSVKTPPVPAASIEQRLMVTLQNQGIDPASIPPALKKALMDDVTKALKTGGALNEEALARLAEYRRLGLTPTRGRLTLDPIDVTREQNAMRMAAATGARDAKLPQIAQENNQRLLGAVEGMGPLSDTYGAGQQAMAPILSRDAMLKGQKSALYNQANQMAGGDIPLERGVIQSVYDQLIEKNRLSSVPADIMAKLDNISKGSVTREGKTYNVPWNVNVLDEIKSDIADAMRRADGRTRNALSIIREVLDSDAVTPDKRFFGGQQLATPAQAQAMRAADQAPANLLDTLNQARAANRNWMNWRESTPGVAAAVNEAAPESWVRDNIISKTAKLDDVTRLAGEIGSSQGALNAVRGQLVEHLKSAAIGKGNATETANFSGRQWLAALSDIGERKLSLFFSPEEIGTLKAIGRVGTIETFQPRGSAVNNSNTGASVANLLQGLGKYVQPVANKLPLGGVAIADPLNSLTLYSMERGPTRNALSGLLMPDTQPRNRLDALMLPGLLAVTP